MLYYLKWLKWLKWLYSYQYGQNTETIDAMPIDKPENVRFWYKAAYQIRFNSMP